MADAVNELLSLKANLVKEAEDLRKDLLSLPLDDLNRASQVVTKLTERARELQHKIVHLLGHRHFKIFPHLAAQKQSLSNTAKGITHAVNHMQCRFHQAEVEQVQRMYCIVAGDQHGETSCEVGQQERFSSLLQKSLAVNGREGATEIRHQVEQRHISIESIRAQFQILLELFEDLNAAVEEQEPLVQQIDDTAQITTEKVDQANTHLNQAEQSLRQANKNRRRCLLLMLLAIGSILAVIIVVVEVLKHSAAARKATSG